LLPNLMFKNIIYIVFVDLDMGDHEKSTLI
jgi:hypothetical protein